MAFDKDSPADNILIRLLPKAIRDNFEAIQSGDPSFSKDLINLKKQGSNPAAKADTYTLYAKEIGGRTELFGINSSSNVLQMTKGAATVAAKGITSLNGGILIAWATENIASGQTISVTGLTTIFSVAIAVDDNTNLATHTATVFGISGNTFKVYSRPLLGKIHYIAIGV
jgi:hypothetical protein